MNGPESTIFPVDLPLKLQSSKKRGRPVRIKPAFQKYLGKDFEFNLYIGFMEHVVEKTLPPHILEEFRQAGSESALRKVFQKLGDLLPILNWSVPETSPGLVSIDTLSRAELTHGLGRFMVDLVSRWLLPGKQLQIFCAPSLCFHFIDFDRQRYFLQRVIVEVANDQDLESIKERLPKLSRETKQTVMAVRHARNVILLKHLTLDQKKAVIQEHMESLLDKTSKDFETSLFDQMYQFLIKMSAEEKIGQIKDRMTPLIAQSPTVFETDIYYEIQHFVQLFRDRFMAVRDIRHITRLIALQYLFRKSLAQQMKAYPAERHLAYKLFKTKLALPSGPKNVLGILVVMNILRDNEMFEQKHTLEAVQHCLPFARQVKDSYVADRTDQDKIRLFYLEVEKEDGTPFTLEEIKELRKRLPRELKAGVENVSHPIFMPRNEEEVMRNILLLSQELKYVRDIPQVVISFDAQSETELSFTVILLRTLKPGDAPLHDILHLSTSSVRFEEFDIKPVGRLRKKYVKEANVFSAKVDKKPFLRKDYSLDLFKARHTVSGELSRILGDIRDFNGGILSKQHELFHELRQSLLATGSNDFLLENFFYSITPPLMQSLLPAGMLKLLFLMMAEALEHDFQKNAFFLKTHWDPEYVLLMAAAPSSAFRDTVFSAVSALKIPSSDLCHTFVKVYEIACLGYIYRCEDPKQCALFYKTVQEALDLWEKRNGRS